MSFVHVRRLGLLMLCAPYLQGGTQKILDFASAVAEMQHFGLRPAPLFALAVIALELGASVAILGNRFRFLGALALSAFTLAATLLANRFWELGPAARFAAANAFFEHIALAGALLLLAASSRESV